MQAPGRQYLPFSFSVSWREEKWIYPQTRENSILHIFVQKNSNTEEKGDVFSRSRGRTNVLWIQWHLRDTVSCPVFNMGLLSGSCLWPLMLRLAIKDIIYLPILNSENSSIFHLSMYGRFFPPIDLLKWDGFLSQVWDSFVFPGARTKASGDDGSLGRIITTSGEQDLS